MENTSNKKIDFGIVFWYVIALIGIGAIITGSVLISKNHNNLMWMPISLGIILTLIGLIFGIYRTIIEHNQKKVRNKGI